MTTAPPVASRATTIRYLTLGLLCSVQMMLNLDDTIVNVALPTIQQHLHMSETDLTWIINAYLLLFGGFLLVGGRSADLFGGKRVFLIGVAVFGVASLTTGLAQNADMLIASRAAQGIGGALASPAALSIVAGLFTEARERTRALGIWAGLGGLAATLGVVLSGVITEFAGWRWCFLINVPVAIAALVLVQRLLPDHRPARTDTRLDGLSAALITGAIAAFDLALIDSGHSAGSATAFRAGLGVILLTGFLLRAGRSRSPMIPLSFFRDRDRAVANFANVLFCSTILSMLFFLTLFLQQVLHFSPLRTGVAWLPFCALVIAGFATAAGLVTKLGVRPVLVAAMASGAVGMYLLAQVSETSSYVALLPGMLIAGFGMGLGFVSITVAAVGETHADITGLASGFVTTTQQLGGALGLGVLSTVALHHHTAASESPAQALTAGFQSAYLVSAVILTCTAVLAGVGIRAATGRTTSS
ncbi:MFS transporter [Nocardia sp. NPDC059240]|uniref:MFS transporter n=1 Tax=Nocardia sp. NPDC059240 TaxID=3346786 RepID=UPI0036CCA08E